jgi:hypothetical protein
MRHFALTRFLVVAGLLVIVGCNKQGATSTPATSSAGDSAALPANSQNAAENIPPPAPAPAAAPVVVHAGTPIVVTVDQLVSSKDSNPGDHFEASLAAPVLVHGQQVIPPGTKVTGTVVNAKSAGKFKGNAELTVTLQSIRIAGQRVSIKTTSVTEAGKGRGKRTGIGAGGGAVVGGLIGAIAGGGKGAAIGAGAGAGAGAAGAGFTGNREIEILPETRLHFSLKVPLELNGN